MPSASTCRGAPLASLATPSRYPLGLLHRSLPVERRVRALSYRWRMLSIRRLALAGASVGIGALLAAPPGLAHAAPAHRVTAIGDSFIAGIGAGSYVESGGCRRSTDSYASLLARATSSAFTDLSCPGATTATVQEQARAIPSNSTTILVQVGGNDIGFGDVAGACTIGGSKSCRTALETAARALAALGPEVQDVLTLAHTRAPDADIVLAGYPSLVQGVRPCSGSLVGILLGPDRLTRLAQLQRHLDRTLQRALIGWKRATAVTRARFIDWPQQVNAHSLCSSEPWYVVPGAGDLIDLLHPTLAAHTAQAASLAARL